MSRAMEGSVVRFQVTGMRVFYMRMWLAVFFMKVAARTLGSGYEIEMDFTRK